MLPTEKRDSIVKALRILYEIVYEQNLNWVVIGSTSLWLQGVDISPKDIDIIADREGAFRIGELLHDFEKRPIAFSRSGRYESYFGQYEVHGVRLEVMADLRILIQGEWVSYSKRLERRIFVEFEGMRLPVTPLMDHLESYEGMRRAGDEEKVRKIQEALERTSV